MDIVFLQSSLWLSGGARVVIEHANRLAKAGHQVSIVIPKDAFHPEMIAEVDPPVSIIQASYPLELPASVYDKLRITFAMAAAVPRCDLIVATHTPTTLVSLIAGRIYRKGIPVWFYQDYPEMFSGRKIEAWLLRHAMGWHRGAVAVSQSLVEGLQQFSKGDIRNVGDAISHYELYTAQLKPKYSMQNIRKRILYLGDFRPRKGIADFLQASEILHASHPSFELILALKEDGDIQTQVPHSKVIRPTNEQLARLYAESDLFVSASWREGFGLPPLEAMACGTPVVLTDSGGVRDYARPGENCLMVPPKRPDLLAEAIRQVLTDPILQARFREQGPITAAQFTWDKVSARMEAALRDFSSTPRAR